VLVLLLVYVPVPKTNRISEADFSALDRLEKNAPQKSTLAKSGIINYTNNKTSIDFRSFEWKSI
jgi:hypothetical protein